MKKLLIVPFVVLLTVNCTLTQFVHNSIPVEQQITSKLEDISLIADQAVELKIFTKADRQQFAQLVMIPTINANKTYALCLRDGNCADLPNQITLMAHGLQIGIDMFVSKMAITPTRDKLSLALNSAITFVNNLQLKGAK